jgi:chromosome partitioning protein
MTNMKGNQTRIVAIANEKGGVGKTATVINLGAALALAGKKTLIVDMDPQHNATSGIGLDIADDAASVYDLLLGENGITAADAVQQTKWENLYIIPSHIDLAGAEIELIDEEGRENKLKESLEPITSAYDYILLDTPPSLSLLTVNVFAFAREVVVPCQTQPYAFAALNDLFDTIDTIREEMNPELRVSGIAATFFDQRTRVSRQIMSKLQTTAPFNDLMFNTVIRNNTTIAASNDVGKPVVHYRSTSYGSTDYRALAAELIERVPE